MNCKEIQKQLSAYYDGELDEAACEQVAGHIKECADCSKELQSFQVISRAANNLPMPGPPMSVWEGVAAELASDEPIDLTASDVSTADRHSSTWRTPQYLALAASIFLVIGSVAWLSRDSWLPEMHGHDVEFVMTMDEYLNRLASDPVAAEQFLIDKYEGQVVEPDSAINLVGYRPAVADGLPTGYTLASTSVLKMPCCTCVKAVCRRDDGSTLVLFEHDDEQAAWFGDRPSREQMCADKSCSLVDLDRNIAATWRIGSRSVTAVGLRGTDEVSAFVNWLDPEAPAQL